MPNYNLYEGTPQFGFRNSRAKIQLFGGAYANGKTTALAIKCIEIATNYPGAECLLARSTYPKLNDTLRRVFLKWCPQKWIKRKPTQDDNTCYLTNGSFVAFRYISQKGRNREDGSSTSNLLSATYDFIGIDQIEDPEITHKDFIDLLGRLRGNATYRPKGVEDRTMPNTGPRWFCATSNPSHNWYYREVVGPYILWRDKGVKTEKLLVDPKTQQPILELYEGDIYSNAQNLEEDFIRTQEAAYKGQMRERYLLGKWAAFEGLVHPSYERGRHLMSRVDMLEHLQDCVDRHVEVKVVEGYDFGIAAASCYMFGFVDDCGRIFVLDGFHQKEFDLYDQPDRIKEIRADYLHVLRVTDKVNADPAIFRRIPVAGIKNTGHTIAKVFSDCGVSMRPASNDILPGIAKVNAYLNGHPKIPHPVTGETPGPLLFVNDELSWFDDEITSYYWKKNLQGNSIDEPIDGADDGMNTTKYLVAFRPLPAEIVIPQDALPPGWAFWHEATDEEEQDMETESQYG